MGDVAFIAPRRWVRLRTPPAVAVAIAPDRDGWAAWLITRDCSVYPLDHHVQEREARLDAESYASIHEVDVIALDYAIGRFMTGHNPPPPITPGGGDGIDGSAA